MENSKSGSSPGSDHVVWIHEDCLDALDFFPGSRAVWVWDDACLLREGWSLKRIVFLYECLLDIPVEILRGDPVDVLASMASTIMTIDSPNPRFQDICRRLESRGVFVERRPPSPFVEIKGPLDLRRFSRYWKRVEPLVLADD